MSENAQCEINKLKQVFYRSILLGLVHTYQDIFQIFLFGFKNFHVHKKIDFEIQCFIRTVLALTRCQVTHSYQLFRESLASLCSVW